MTRKRNPSGSYSLIFEFLGGAPLDLSKTSENFQLCPSVPPLRDGTWDIL